MAEVQMSEYKPSFVYSSRKRSAVRRITPAGWLTLAVVAAVLVLGGALVVNAVKGSFERSTWGGAPQSESVAAVAPAKAGARATSTPDVVPTATPMPEDWVWWSEQMVESDENGLVPSQGVQQEITIMWEIHRERMSLPLETLATLTVDNLVDDYATTREFATRIIDSHEHYDKVLMTGKLIKVQGEAVNLRDGPGTSYEIVGQLEQGAQLQLLGEEATNDQVWYRGWEPTEQREVWIASWVVRVTDNNWPYPEYEEHEVVVHDCTDDGLTCWITDTMREGGTGYYNLATGETGLYTGNNAPYPPDGIWVGARMVYDSERMVWLCDGLDWGLLDEDE